MPRSIPMDHQAAERISAAAGRDPASATATSGFDDRAQAAADRNDPDDEERSSLRRGHRRVQPGHSSRNQSSSTA